MKNPVRFLTQRLLAPAVLLQALFFFTLDLRVQAAVNQIYVLTAGTTNSAEAADRLNSVNSDGTSDTTLASGATALFHIPQRMAVDAANNFAYVIDSDSANTQFHILKVNLTTGSATSIFDHSSTGYNLKDVKIDFTNNLLYVLTADGAATAGADDALFRMDFSGGSIVSVATSIGNVPQSMALDVAGGFAYFMDSNQKKIFKVALTGGAVSLFQDVSASASGFTSSCLDIDRTNGILYYTGAGGTTGAEAADALYKVGLASGSPTALSSGGSIGIPKALALDVPNGFAYVGDNSATTGRSVYKVDLTSGAQTLVNTPTGSPGGLNDLAIANVSSSGTPVTLLGAEQSQYAAAPAYTSTMSGYVIPAGTNRLIVVTASHNGATNVSSVTAAGVELIRAVQHTDTLSVDSIWYAAFGTSAATTPVTIVATFSGPSSTGGDAFISAATFSNVDQSTPVTGPQAVDNNASSSSLNVASTSTNDLVFDIFDGFAAFAVPTAVPNAGQTAISNKNGAITTTGGGFANYKTSSKPGAVGNVNMGWTSNGNFNIQVGVNIKAGAIAAPVATTTAATAVTGTTATFNGTANASGNTATPVNFEYGLTAKYEITDSVPLAATPSTVSGSSNTAVSKAIIGLTAGTTYHYRVTVGGILGNDMTFTTAAATPTVTATTTAILATATTVTITGTNFDSVTPGNNTVVFTPAGTGTVTAATSTSLTVTSVTGLRGGPLSAVVTNGSGNSGAAVQVANVAPVITVNTGNITTLANQLTINGVGFDPTAFANNSVVFSPAGTGNVAGSTSGSLNVTGISGLTTGALNAVVTVNGVASASAQVATVVTAPNLTINDVTLNEGNAGTTSFTFTVSLSAPAPTGGVTFDIATQDGTATTADSDYTAKSLTSQTIPASSSIYTFTVLVNGDTKYEPNESFFVNVTNVTNAVLSDGVAMGSIINDDPLPNVSINTNSAVTEGNAGTTTLNFTLSLSGASSQPISVVASTFDGTATTADNDYVANSQIISFAPGVTSMPFNVTVKGDVKPEGDETLFVRLTLPQNAGLGVSVGQGTITNDDAGGGNLYVVTTNSDATWTTLNLANGKIDGTNTVTLRSAVIAANQSGAGPHTISIPVNVGTIHLTQNNPGPVTSTWANPAPDLEIGSNFSTIIIQGVGGTAAIVQDVAGYDVITTGIKSDGFTPAIVNLSLDHLDISGGTFTGIFVGADDGLGNSNSVSFTQITNCNIHNNSNSDAVYGQGGALQSGAGYLTVSDTIFANNSASNSATGQGGAIWFSLPNASGQGSGGNLSITDCAFTSNTAGISGGLGGGAVYVGIVPTVGVTSITRCTFTGNSSAADGGAIVLNGNRQTLIAGSNFDTNSVTGAGHGGAIAINKGAASTLYSRFAGNTAATAVNGDAIYRSAGATGTAIGNFNWWRTNAGPPVNAVVGNVILTTWIKLGLTATPNAIPLLGTSALQADFFTASNTSTVALADLSVLLGRTATYGSPVLGGITNADASLMNDGRALATFTAGAVSGAGSASVTIDGQTVSANITVGSLAGDSSLTSLSASAGALSPVFASGTLTYAVSALNATTTTTITPTATNGSSTLSYNVNGGGFTAIVSGATSAPITLNAAGVNTPIIVKVISADTTTTTLYTVNVTRAAAGVGAPTTLYTSGVDSPPGAPGTTFASVRSGMAIASSGALSFRGFLTIGTGGVDANNYMGMWKSPDGTAGAVALVARSGSVAPNTNSALFDILPINGVINNAAQVTFSSFTRVNTGSSPVTSTSNDGGVWSELGTGGLKLLLREGTAITGGTVTNVAPTTWVATGTNNAAFTVQFAGGSALVRGGFTAGTTPAITTLATEGATAPALAGGDGGTLDSFAGNSSDPRIDDAGNVAFLGYVLPVGSGIMYVNTSNALSAIASSNQVVPDIVGAQFTGFERPSLSSGGTTVAFRAFLTGANSQAVVKGNPTNPAGLVTVAKTNDTAITGTPVGRKLWSIWSPFTNATGHVAFRASLVDTGTNANENRAILTDTSGVLTVVAKVGDTAPGAGAETFANFDHPVIGDGDQTAFVASTSAGTVGVWRQAAGGGALLLVLKVGDTLTINATTETVASITIPGSSSDDRKYETKCIDSAGHVLIHVTYASGKTGIILSAP